MSNFLKDIIKETGNEYATLASDGVTGGDVDSFIDTGSYAFNALLSGSIFGGLPGNRITAIAGEAATGKTFFALGVCKSFLDADKDAGVIYFESENAISKDMADFCFAYFLNKRKVARFLFDQKYISPFTEYFGVWNDEQVPNTYSHYSDMVMETLLI